MQRVLDRNYFGWPSAEESSPPADERLAIQMVCVVEMYTPVQAGKLPQRLAELGFRHDRASWWDGPDIVRDIRGTSGEAWVNLGIVVPEGRARSDCVETELQGLTAGFLSLHALTPSITALRVFFILDDERTKELDAAARRTDQRATGRLTSRGYTIEPPANIKRSELLDVRRRARDLGASWIAANLPGFFASRRQPMPTAQVISTETGTRAGAASRDQYLRLAGIDYWPPYVWVSDEIGGWSITHDGEDSSVLTISGRSVDVLDTDEVWDDDARFRLAQQLGDTLGKNLVLWGAMQVVAESQRGLARIRDQGLGISSSLFPTRRLKRIGAEFLRDSLESRTVAAELGEYARDSQRFARDASEWHGVDALADRRMLDVWQRELVRRSEVLTATEDRLGASLMVESNLLSAIAGLRVQFILLVVGIASLILSLVAITIATG